VRFWLGLALVLGLSSCVQNDPSTYIVDDQGQLHHTKHYTLDNRGRSYFPKTIEPTGEREFIFDPKAWAWAAYSPSGQRLWTGSASGGRDFCEEDPKQSCRTISGTFRVYKKRGLECKSGEYPVETEGGAKMPYCIYFLQGFSIHAGYDVPMGNVSHGCIRVLPSAAKWLNEEFLGVGTKVTVLSYEDKDDNNWVK
jgi:L,D-transpeptidase catalytic domain